MSTFFERFKKLCQQNQKNIYDYGKSTVNRWSNNTTPNGDTLIQISKDLNCSVDYLLGLTDVAYIVTSEELKTNIPDEYKTIIGKYSNLNQHDKEIVNYVLNMEPVK